MRDKKIIVLGVVLSFIGLIMLFFPLSETRRYSEIKTHIPINRTLTEVERQAIWKLDVGKGEQIEIQISTTDFVKLKLYEVPTKLFLLEDYTIGRSFSQTWNVPYEGTYWVDIKIAYPYSSTNIYGDAWVNYLRRETVLNQTYRTVGIIVVILGISTALCGAYSHKVSKHDSPILFSVV